ncbi:hypothetical protein ABBQ32_012470 [Trebouxia sp. C0010 RCD-2024]
MCLADSQEMYSLQDSYSLCVLRLSRECESPRLLEDCQSSHSVQDCASGNCSMSASLAVLCRLARRLADFLESLGGFETVRLGPVTETGVNNQVRMSLLWQCFS